MLHDEQMSNKVRVEHSPDKGVNVYGAKEPALGWFRAPTRTFRDTSKS